MTGTAIATTGPQTAFYPPTGSNQTAFTGLPTQGTIIIPPMFDEATITSGRLIVPSNGIVRVYATTTNNCSTVYVQQTGTSSTTNVITPITTTTAGVYYTVTGNTGWTIQGNGAVMSPEDLARHQRRQAVVQRGRITKARSAIKKALKLIDNIGFGDEIRIFIGGDEIVIDNPESIFKFVLKRGRHSIVERTVQPGYSTPYSLELLTKDDVHVANLCVYLKDTPVLDQVLAVAMYIKTGNEEDVLEKANWFNRTNDDGVKRLVNEYNPRFGKKLGFNLPYEEPRGQFNFDNIGDIVIATNQYVHTERRYD